MKINDILNKYLSAKNISIRDFARRANLSHTYISNIAKGYNDNLTLDAIHHIAVAMNMSQSELFNLLDDSQSFEIPANSIDVPLYASISCGEGVFIDDCIEDYITIPDKFAKKGKEYFANTAKGDSMIGKNIQNNDILIFEKTQVLNNGEIGAFCIDNEEAVCKIFRKLSNGVILLESANPKYDPIEVDVEKDCFRIIGKYKFKFSIEQ